MNKKILIITILFLIIDLVSKIIVDKLMALEKSIRVIKHFFRLTKVYNYGASWSILNGERILFLILAIVILIVLYFYHKRFKENTRNNLAFGLVYAGILGNFCNRLIYGYVIDFNIFGYNYPIFNLADTFIVMGVILLIIAIIKKEDEYAVNS